MVFEPQPGHLVECWVSDLAEDDWACIVILGGGIPSQFPSLYLFCVAPGASGGE